MRWFGLQSTPSASKHFERLHPIYRKARGWSQTRLALFLGVNPTTLARWEM
ncbi:MAG: helix-turn-helix transcriptional regulator [Opitutaceae bacterium]|nr:helix-turn-helix transcriptional regulator [Opitutaceae bacterium]